MTQREQKGPNFPTWGNPGSGSGPFRLPEEEHPPKAPLAGEREEITCWRPNLLVPRGAEATIFPLRGVITVPSWW